ncbi:MAG: glycosyltransferase family 4 protein [Tenacibaculum sp.]
MKIGMVLDNVFPPDPRVENEAVELIKNNCEVFLFCLNYGVDKKQEIINKIQVRRYKSNGFEYKMSALAYSLPIYTFLMQKKIRHFIEKNNIEVLHIHDIRIAQAAFKANKNKLPTVLDLHENRPEIMRYYPHMQKLTGKLLISIKKWKQKEECFIKKASKVVVVSQQAKQEIVDRVGVAYDKITVAPNTVREAFFKDDNNFEIPYQKSNKEFTLLYLGDTGNRRGLETVLNGMLILNGQIKNLKFVVVGKVNLEFKNKINRLGLTKQVKLLGWQNDTSFPSWIKIADVCLCPLHRNIHHDTTYANKIFQYMSIGKPLLVSNAKAQKEIVERVQAGLVHEAENASDFSKKLLTLYQHKELRELLGQNGKEFVEKQFTWSKTSKDLINMYKQLNKREIPKVTFKKSTQ